MISQRIRLARKFKKLTQEQLASKVQTTKGTISNYENGYSTPSNEMIILLADTLDVSADYLLGRTDEPNISNVTSEPPLKAWLRQENADLSESEMEQLGSEIEDYLAIRRKRILEKKKEDK